MIDYLRNFSYEGDDEVRYLSDAKILSIIKTVAASFNEKLLRGIANLNQKSYTDVLKYSDEILTSWPVTDELAKRYSTKEFITGDKIITLSNVMMNRYQVRDLYEMIDINDCFNEYYIDLFSHFAKLLNVK